MNDLIHEFGDLIDNTVGAQIRLVTALERRLPAVQIDPTHLEMAVLNILINARDAMPGGGTVTIATELWKLNGNAAAHGLPRSEEHTSELQSLMRNSYAVFCLKKKNNTVSKSNHIE